MFLELDEHQRALRSLARDVLADVSSLARLREVWDDPTSLGAVWGDLAAVGLTGIGTPEQDGGSGGSEVEAAVVLEAAGHAALPEPLIETLGIVAPTLRDHAPETLRRRWAPRIAAGDATIAVCVGPEVFAVAGSRADAYLCEVAGTLHLVPAGRVRVVPVASVDPTRDLVRVEDVEVDDGSALPDADPHEAWLRGAAATASATVGVAARLLELAVEHAKVREQFGTPIGAFQAVQQPLADAYVAIDAARTAHWYAAYTRATAAADADRAARTAKAAASDACGLVDRVSLQVHAGVGFTWEHDLHLLLKRAAAWRAAYGAGHVHRAALADELFTVSDGVGGRG